MKPATTLLIAALPLLSACAQTASIRELGHPQFEPVVGAETRFERVGKRQVGELDAFPDSAGDGNHRFVHSIVPAGSEAEVVLDVRAGAHPDRGVPVRALSVAVYPVTTQEAMAFASDGRLPAPEAPLKLETSTERQEGVLGVVLRLPRDRLPAGTERLACPILVQLEDGWIHIAFYQTVVPAAVPDAVNDPPAEPTEPPSDEGAPR